MPPIWINEDGQRAQTQPCPRPGCGREVPIRRYRYETLRQIDWPPFRVARYVEWCGHGQALIPMPDGGELGADRADHWHSKVNDLRKYRLRKAPLVANRPRPYR